MKKMVEKVCPVCSKGFVAEIKKIYCCPSCANFARNERAKKQYRENELVTKKCRYCGKMFQTTTRRITCSDVCLKDLRAEGRRELNAVNTFWKKVAEGVDRHEAINLLKKKYNLNSNEAENKYNAWRNNYVRGISL